MVWQKSPLWHKSPFAHRVVGNAALRAVDAAGEIAGTVGGIFERQPQYQDVGDAEMAYWRVGSGPALVFVHGWPLSSATWAKLVPILAEHFTCVVIDQAGAGQTRTSPDTDYNFRGQARRLNAFLDALGDPTVHVLAQNTGATIARAAALQAGSRIASLVLTNTEIPGHRPPYIEMFQTVTKLPGAARVFQQLLRSRTFVRSAMGFGGCFTDKSLLDGDFRQRIIEPLVRSRRRVEGINRYLWGIDWGIVDGLAIGHARLDVPVLFVWGEDDPTFPIEQARPMAAQLPDCRGFQAVPGASLLVYEERATVVAEHALAFYRELGAI
ncbi:MAG: alpha/beta hydrolase [Actinomycetia bacterium]|nr:alpha/beta hydrolase [Actinomycetes bacterium]